MKIYVLDHGYVELIEAWGKGVEGDNRGICADDGTIDPPDDYEVGIIEAARQSTQGAFRGWNEDVKLLRTLYNHQDNQSTPFEAAGMTIEVQAPIFVFREWQRHRTQSYNEASARYTPLPDLYYQPSMENVEQRCFEAHNNKNKQAGSMATVPDYDAMLWLTRLDSFYQIAEAHYKNALADGIPKELARLVMPVGHYSRMRTTANLRNWLAFLKLRMAPNAQWEIRQFADVVGVIVKSTFPHTWKLFEASITAP